ncbi:MAG: Lrp/AsnC family transcriptional regulator [Brevundimonas sp.]
MIALNPGPRRLLAVLQEDASTPVHELADQVGMSRSACRAWTGRLLDLGVILRRAAVLDRKTLGLDLAVFVSIRGDPWNPVWREAFERVQVSPAVTECHRLSGGTDYLLKVIVRDVAAYDAFHRRYFSGSLLDASARFALEQIKYTTALPLDEA